MLSDIQNCIENLQIGNAYIATLYWQEKGNAFILVLCQFHSPVITQPTIV